MLWVLGQNSAILKASYCSSHVAQLGRQIDGTMTLGLVNEGWRKLRAQITPWRSTVQKNYRDETGDNFLAVLWVFSSQPLTVGFLHLEVSCLLLLNKHFCGALIISQICKMGAQQSDSGTTNRKYVAGALESTTVRRSVWIYNPSVIRTRRSDLDPGCSKGSLWSLQDDGQLCGRGLDSLAGTRLISRKHSRQTSHVVV